MSFIILNLMLIAGFILLKVYKNKSEKYYSLIYKTMVVLVFYFSIEIVTILNFSNKFTLRYYLLIVFLACVYIAVTVFLAAECGKHFENRKKSILYIVVIDLLLSYSNLSFLLLGRLFKDLLLVYSCTLGLIIVELLYQIFIILAMEKKRKKRLDSTTVASV
ncbi:MAG: hypothetical protein E7615_04125 [Ruminococcaceae bacterium]|nr:hypothetical protein [Oscillospiraceae bacterium]